MMTIRACTADFLHWLSQHGIDPELPLIIISMLMGAIFGYYLSSLKNHRDEKRRREHVNWLLKNRHKLYFPEGVVHIHSVEVPRHVHTATIEKEAEKDEQVSKEKL